DYYCQSADSGTNIF
nr:immunoglobulin light chain junction region [Macaca mulatta]